MKIIIMLFTLQQLNEVYDMNIGKKVSFRNFGYIPTGSFKVDFFRWLFGYQNLFKRLQAKDLFRLMNIEPQEAVLDFGCGAGFFTVEMAKQAKKAIGIDINNYVEKIVIPPILNGKLEFIKTNGEKLPFEDNTFDKVLASEVLPMLSDPMLFLREIKRVLKPNGHLFILNGAGHPSIREMFEVKGSKYNQLKSEFPERFPQSYECYCKMLQKSFKTGQDKFFEEQDIKEFLEAANFELDKFAYTPSKVAGDYFSWTQFRLYLSTGRTLSQHNFYLKYWWLSFLSLFNSARFKGGLMCMAINKK